jgi:ABC-2 type transport system permease protein
VKTWSRFGEVFRFELAYQLGRVSTRVYFAIFLALSFVLTGMFIADARRDGYFFNAPIITIGVTVIASMLALLVTAAVAGDAATRDTEARMDSLLYTTPLGKAAYFGGRFLGAFAVTALLLLAVPLGLLLATRMPNVEPQLLGPFRPAAYLISYFLFAIPNALVATAVLFSLAAVSRRAITSYAGAAVLFFSTFISERFIASHLGNWSAGKLLDPLGYTTVQSLWRSLNPLQRNTLLGVDASLLTNRMLWLGVAAVVLAFASFRFRFAYQTTGGRGKTAPDDAPSCRWTRVAVPSTRRTFGVATRMRQLLAIAMDSFRELVTGRAWWIVPVVAAIFILTAPELLEVELRTPGAATTARVAAMYDSELARLIILLITLSVGELVWREREARIHAIADVTPVPEWLSFLGRFLSLCLMLAVTQLVLLLAGVAVQVMQGAQSFDVALYVQVLFGIQLTGYLLFAALAMVVHVLLNQKYVAHVIVLLAYFATAMAREIGVEHNLLLYGGAPAMAYSDMGGFGLKAGPWLWFTFYWTGWALLFAVVTYLFWIRGEERGMRRRIALARHRLTRWPAAIGVTALAIIGGAGGFIFYNTNVLNRYRTDAEVEQRRAEYERRYGKYESLPQPLLAATKLQVDFYPSRGAATIRGSYRLDNRIGVAINTIHLGTHLGVETTGVSFDRPSRVTLSDDDLGHRIYALGRALQPGESLRMNFQVAFEPRGFTNAGRDSSVIRNGSWIEHRGEQNQNRRQWLPVVGYQNGRELTGVGIRAQYGVPARPDIRPLHDPTARDRQQGREKIEFEVIVGTDAGQLGVAPGELRRTWTENGRHYSHYVADAPIADIYAIFSAAYAVHRAQWQPASGASQPVAIEIFHHPTHPANLERMVRGVRASLDSHTRHFGAYPHRQLRLVEFPSTGGGLGLTSYPGTIKYSEGFALVRPGDDPRVDLPFAVIAHEIGHQWFGHQLVPAEVEGAPLLTESLAWYSAMQTIEETLGREPLTRLLDVMRREYMAPHQTRQVSLLRAVDHIDGYRTGPFAMHALRESVGAERVNAALRNMLAKYDPTHPPYPNSLDLYAELRAVTPVPMHDLLKDLFEEITFWDLQTKKATVQPAGNGQWRVTLQIDAQKLKADAMGKETPVAMNDPIEVSVFAADGKPLYLKRHRVRSGTQTITITVTGVPARAGIDPDHELLDRKPDDNGVEVGGTFVANTDTRQL